MSNNDNVLDIVKLGLINNEASLEINEDIVSYQGDSIDVAFLALALKMDVNSKDIEILTPLPIKSKKVVAAKLNWLIISQYIMSAMLALPGVLIYGYLQNLNLIY